jgi:DNA polymerase I-like protein with 3'-5' exonuclease and polymerase domains
LKRKKKILKVFKIDFKRRSELTIKYKDLYKESQESLNFLVGKKVNCNSPKQIRELLYNQLSLPLRAEVNEETLVALYANNAKNDIQKRTIDYILNIRKYRKTLGTYLEARLDYDGRMRTSYNIVGTETGRRSTTVLKQPIRPEKLGTSLLTWTKHGDIGSDIRSFLIPDDGYEFVEVDLSQAEARIALLYADDEESLELFNTVDFHKWTAARCFDVKEELITNDQRFVGKTVRYLRQYFGSKRRLMQTINTDSRRFHIGCLKTDEYKCDGKHVSFSEWKCGEILSIFDGFTPKLQNTFHRAVREQLESNRTFENCYGRKRTFFERFDDELLRSAFAHSCSSVVADHVGWSLIHLSQQLPSFEVQIEFHDALFGQAKKEDITKTAQVIQSVLEREIDFRKGSIQRRPYKIPAEIMTGMNWKDMKRIKV